MGTRNRATRRQERLVKGARRIREDRAQHGEDHSCACFEPIGKGYTFSQFADNPKRCSRCYCCGNPRAVDGPTRQELKAPKVTEDW